MGNEIARHTHRTTPARPTLTNTPDPGYATHLDDVTFQGKGYTYDQDIPTAFRPGAADHAKALTRGPHTPTGTLARYDENIARENAIAPRSDAETARVRAQTIASGARQLDKPRKSGGRVVQRRIGWQATPTLIVITTAERELAQGSDRRYRPTGPWLIENRKTHPSLDGPARKRVGTLTDTTPPASPNVHRTGPAPTSPDEDFPEGTFALSFLPAQVRQSVRAAVPAPTVFDGTALQYSDPRSGTIDRLEINVIRMNNDHAVVVQATRKPAGNTWEVSQATYRLGTPEVERA